MKNAIKFNLHNVTNGTAKARVHYSTSRRVDGPPHVTIYSKDYGHALAAVPAAHLTLATDTRAENSVVGGAVLFADHPLYAAALAAANRASAAWDARWAKRVAKYRA